MKDFSPKELKEFAGVFSKYLGIDEDSTLEKFQEEIRLQKEREERYKQLVREFNNHQSFLFDIHKDKRFEVTTDFVNTAMEELRTSFVLGEEGGMLAFFRPIDNVLFCNEFYDTNWIQKNGYGCRSPLNIWLGKGDSSDDEYSASIHSFGFGIERLTRLMRQRNKHELLITCHTHHGMAYPSEKDAQPYSLKIIIGFDKVSEDLNQLIYDCCKPRRLETVTGMLEYHGQMPAREWREYLKALKKGNIKRQIQNDISPEVYDRVVMKSRQTIGLFYTDGSGNINRIPLYVGSREIL